MIGTPPEPREWTARRLGTVIVMAVVVQAGLIWWLSEKTPFLPRAANRRPAVQLTALFHSEILTLTAPTLFSLPHPDGFSGPAWLDFRPQDYQPSETTNAPQLWLALAAENLGASFREFMKSIPADRLTRRTWPAPPVTRPGADAPQVLASESLVRIKGALARRGLLSALEIPSWPNPDILASSEVLVWVDAWGNPVSAVLIESSGYKPADAAAVKLAQSAGFGTDESALAQHSNDPSLGLVSGRMIFQWRTLAPGTNSAVNPR